MKQRDRLAEEYSIKNEYSQIPYREDIKRDFISGYDACREQMQAEIDNLKKERSLMAQIAANNDLELMEEKAKSQKLLAALDKYKHLSLENGSSHFSYAAEAIAEYEGKK